ncbi:MAG: hypothetical protein LBH00_06885 [Planctomycetaceae bacterium]|nr:hypothetical protein [Planctomycetaceae bacterium]
MIVPMKPAAVLRNSSGEIVAIMRLICVSCRIVSRLKPGAGAERASLRSPGGAMMRSR